MKRTSYLTVSIIAAIVFILATVSSIAPAAYGEGNTNKVVVDPTNQYQTFDGWGTSLAWFANIMGGAPNPVRNRFADLIFDPNRGLGLNIARYNIGGGENPQYHFEGLRANMPGYETLPGDWDWNADYNQRWFLQAAKARGANIFEAFSNSPPYWMTNSGSTTGAVDCGDNLNPAHLQDFSNYLATVTSHFQSNWGIQFTTLDPLNEPMGTYWCFGGYQEGSHFDVGLQAQTIDSVGAELQTQNLLTRVAASDENTIDQELSTWNSFGPQTQAYVSQINTHAYGGSERVGLAYAAANSDKDLWMSEYGDGDGTGLSMSEDILQDVNQMHAAAWVYWQAVDEAAGWGFLDENLDNPNPDYLYTINEKYYVMGNYSKFVRPGYKIISIGNNQSLAAYSEANQQLVIVSTNNTYTAQDLTFDLSLFNSVGNLATPYRTSATENLVQLSPISVNQGQFSTMLAPDSVTTFVLNNVSYIPAGLSFANPSNIGSGDDQYTYSGSWTPNAQGHSKSYRDSTAGDSYSVNFNGTQAYMAGEKGPQMGIVTVSVDDKQAATVDLYSQNEQPNALVYATPTLPNGEHTLTVINTGLLDSQELHTAPVPPKPTSASKPAMPAPGGPPKPNKTPYVTSDTLILVPNATDVSTSNLLTNGDFETSALAPWYGQWNPGLAGVETNSPYQGMYDGYLHPNSNQDVGMQQDMTAPQTGWYSLTAYCATNLSGDVQLGLNINGSLVKNYFVTANAGYTPYTIQFQAQAGQTISVWYYAGRQNGWATIDNVQIVSNSGPVQKAGSGR